MKFTIFLFLSFSCFKFFAQSADLPLLFETDFSQNISINDFECTDFSAWRINTEQEALELFGESQYQPKVRSPRNIAILKDYKVGDFILEMDLKQTGREYGHRDMCLFFGMKDASNFYYVHIASKADDHAHSIFLVNDEPRKSIATERTEGINWGTDWHHVKIARTMTDGKIEVYFDDMERPIMQATDQHFDFGYVGFGSFDDTGMIDNIRLFGKTLSDKIGFFKSK
ncbi:MAG: hypothetical protein AAF806_01830 [Bacteroidota bacterium]